MRYWQCGGGVVPMNKEYSLSELENNLDYRFKDRTLLKLALTHKSLCPGEPQKNNERLEFLGDAVLQIIVSDHLYHQYLGFEEGRLAKSRAFLVSQPTLASHARTLGLDKYLRVAKSAAATRAFERDSLLCDVYEAVIGAVYLDSGLDAARPIILRHLSWLEGKDLEEQLPIIDAKSTLQERLQQYGQDLPTYHTTREHGPDHAKEFVIEVVFKNKVLGRGTGRTKKEAAQNAAREALVNLDFQS